MTLFQSIILGIVQGLTEFLPVSSSAHLYFAKLLLGVEHGEQLLYFDLFCHAGTLLALTLFLKKEIIKVLCSLQSILLFTLAILPLIPAYFLLKSVRTIASDPAYLGFFFIVTALLLFLSTKKQKIALSEPIKVKDVLCIGAMQTIALLPGISRSGSTIAAARLLGWDWSSAARFSFLLAIPTILGGLFLESRALFQQSAPLVPQLPFSCYAAGFITSFLVGCWSVRLIFWVYEKGRVLPFAIYCFCLGIFALWALHGKS